MGIILATAGSAVGLGNIWRFPYTVGQDGGAAFIILNIVCILLLGIPGMVCEFIVGRNAGTNAVRAYGRLSGIKAWRWVGYMGILSSTIILGFYSVVAGWCLHYLFASFFGRLNGDATAISQYFSNFSSSLFTPIWFALGFIVITHLVVSKGVRGGIERVSKLLMPILFVLLLIIVVASCMLPGAIKGVEFLLKPDFSKVNADVFLDALGQAFFSLSLGTACLCTYASYFGQQLSQYPVSTRLSLNGTIIVARDIAHAKLKARLDAGEGLPDYFKNHPVLYAGPAKTPTGMPCGSMGPTTANRMDPYVDEFQDNGGSMIMIAKGNRTQAVTDACKKHGGFYLGSIGGPAAVLSMNSIKSIECVEYPELGMEAVWKIEVENFPAFILVDDKGNDFFSKFFH